MKKIVSTSSLRVLFTLLAAVMTLSASAQGIEIYNGSTLEKSYNSPHKVVLGVTSSGKTISVYNGGTLVKTYTGSSYSAKLTNKTYVTKITLNKTSLRLRADNGEQLYVSSVTPSGASNAVTWSSSEPSVVAVTSSGYVTGVADGVATITATAADGSGVTATATVTCYSYTPEKDPDCRTTIEVLNEDPAVYIVVADMDEFTQSEIDKMAAATDYNEYFGSDVASLLDKDASEVSVLDMQNIVAGGFDIEGDDVEVQIETAETIDEDEKALLMIAIKEDDTIVEWRSFVGIAREDNKMEFEIPRETVLDIQNRDYAIMAILK